jgi:hypothetical protein
VVRLSSLVTLLAVALPLILPSPAIAATIQSNGTGGGEWTTASTWQGGVVPGQNDTVIVLSGDTITHTVINQSLSAGVQTTIQSGAVVEVDGGAILSVDVLNFGTMNIKQTGAAHGVWTNLGQIQNHGVLNVEGVGGGNRANFFNGDGATEVVLRTSEQ